MSPDLYLLSESRGRDVRCCIPKLSLCGTTELLSKCSCNAHAILQLEMPHPK